MASGEVVEALELPSYDEASGKGKVYGILEKDVSRMMLGFWVETVLSMLCVVDFAGCLGVAMSGCLLVFFFEKCCSSLILHCSD